MLITRDEDGRLNTTVYWKPTHTDQYLHWDSHRAITSKYSMIGTLYHRARTICSNPSQLQKEEKHLFKSLRKCKYPIWVLNRVKLKSETPALKKIKKTSTNQLLTTAQCQNHTLLYLTIKGLVRASRELARNISKEVIPSKTSLWLQRIKIQSLKSGVIYRYKCDRVDCDEEYIRESARNFEERFKEHLKTPSPIHDHLNTSCHAVTIDSFSILGREDQNLMRTIKQALYIRVNNPSLNRI